MQQKNFDLIIWGATGFTGQLVVEYLWKEYGKSDLKWAIAGRDSKKLEQVISKFGMQGIPFLIADSFDLPSLKELASQTKVICSTVGPYSMYGDALVKACVEESCNYCDLTGEVPWMRKTIDQYHHEAIARKIKIVHSCGFDSIPSDLGVLEVQRTFFEKHGYYAGNVFTRIATLKGELSGGTYSSMSNLITEARTDKSIQKILSNTFALNPDPGYQGAEQSDLKSVKKDKITGLWICPFIMSGINTKIVRRSHALMNFPYGHKFIYKEALMCGKGFTGWVKANAILLALGLFLAAKPGSFLKKIIDWKMPKPGEGPNEKSRNEGYFKFLIFAQGHNEDESIIAVRGDKDPGYGSTSRMLAESAICLALGAQLPQVFGVLTPSVAMGKELLNRLETKAGVTFKVIEQ